MVPDKKKNGFSLMSTSYHMAASQSKTPNPSKLKDIRKQPNNFMSIIEGRKDEGKPNPKSQSVLQDYNIKFEKGNGNAGTHAKKKSSNYEGKQATVLNKLVKGQQVKELVEQRMEDMGYNFGDWGGDLWGGRKEDNSEIKMMNDSFGKLLRYVL